MQLPLLMPGRREPARHAPLLRALADPSCRCPRWCTAGDAAEGARLFSRAADKFDAALDLEPQVCVGVRGRRCAAKWERREATLCLPAC